MLVIICIFVEVICQTISWMANAEWCGWWQWRYDTTIY